MSSITELAAQITANTRVIDSHFESTQLPNSSFSLGAAGKIPSPALDSQVQGTRIALIDDSKASRNEIQATPQVIRELSRAVCIFSLILFFSSSCRHFPATVSFHLLTEMTCYSQLASPYKGSSTTSRSMKASRSPEPYHTAKSPEKSASPKERSSSYFVSRR